MRLLFFPPIPFALTILAVSVALLGQSDAEGARSGTSALISSEIADELDQSPTVRVVVTLREPAALAGETVDVAALKTQVAAAQDRALSSVPDGALSITRRYEAVPAIAGVVNKEGLEALRTTPGVGSVTLDRIGTIATAESGPLVRTPEVHGLGLTGEGLIVAVLDTGVDTDHPDLADDIAFERCFLTVDPCGPLAHPAEDDHSHGTNVSGIITSTGTIAPPGIAPDAQIAAYKVLGSGGNGLFSDWTAALDDIIADHPEVDAVNMSLQSGIGCPAGAMASAVETLRKQGVPVFIATGNFGEKDGLNIPACIEESLSVGATYDSDIGSFTWPGVCTDETTAADKVTCWSNSDEGIDLIGPGQWITSTGLPATALISSYRGTSQAAPHAAAIAALLLEAFPGLSVDEIETRLKATGTLVTDSLSDEDPDTNRTTPRVDARVALLGEGVDFDGDGCNNEREWGPDPGYGGRRNPLNPYDFYDINGDGAVNLLDDALGVAAAFGPAKGPNYDVALDRSAPPPDSDPWDMGPPDGAISVPVDILGALAQFGHSCVR